MYKAYNKTFYIDQDIFYDGLSIFSYDNSQKWIQRGKFSNKDRGCSGLIEFVFISEDLKNLIIRTFGNPYLKNDKATFTDQLSQDQDTIDFYRDQFVYKDGSRMFMPKQEEYLGGANILKLYIALIDKYYKKIKITGCKANCESLKKKFFTIINEIKTKYFPNTIKQKSLISYPEMYVH